MQLAMYKKLQKFEGGKVVVATGVPHKCPMSPLEITFFLIDYFKKRGIWDKVDLHYTYPIGRVHSLEPVAEMGSSLNLIKRELHMKLFLI